MGGKQASRLMVLGESKIRNYAGFVYLYGIACPQIVLELQVCNLGAASQ